MLEDLKLNQLPVPTWNRLKMNDCILQGLSVPQDVCEARVSLEGSVCLNKNNSTACGCGSTPCAVHGMAFAAVPTGVGTDMAKLGEGQSLRLVADAGKSVAAVTLRYNDNDKCYNRLEIDAHAGSDLTVVMTYISTAAAAGEASVQTKLLLGAGARVKLVQVQLLGRGFVHINDVGADLADGTSLEVLQLALGADKIYDGVRAELTGEGSSLNAAVGYYGRRGQQLDMNFIANHYGKKTTCTMSADGVLQQGARKLYRGTIDFKNGCAGATGDEKETVLLLSDDVVNQTIPLILCSEEDVQGNHGASIGKLDEELLFYLMSRGFSEQEAVNMMAKAKIDALCRQIDDEETVALVQRYLEGVMADGQ